MKFNPYLHNHTPRIGVLARHEKEIEIDTKKCFHQISMINNVFKHVKDGDSSRRTSNFLELKTFKTFKLKNNVS